MRQTRRRALTVGLLLIIAGLAVGSSAQAVTFRNTSGISIPDGYAPASPYPSTITVPVLTGTVTGITFRIRSYVFPFADDVGILVQAPDGRAIPLLEGGPDNINANLTFSDVAGYAPQGVNLTGNHTYRATDYYASDDYPAGGPTHLQYANPGPDGGGAATLASTFNNLNPTGTWKLWVADFDTGPHTGGILGGWDLSIQGTAQVANSFTLGRLIRAKKGLRAKIPATFPNPGKVLVDDVEMGRVSSNGVAARQKNGKRHGLLEARTIGVQPGTSTLPIVPNARGRRIIAKRGRALVHLYVAYFPDSGTLSQQTKQLALFGRR
jgi:hypothetical protein